MTKTRQNDTDGEAKGQFAAPGLLSRIGRGAAHFLIRFYQLTLSAFVGRRCRHLPTCSDYTDTAIGRFGLWAGGWVGLARILRCHPWGSSGFDPVPDRLPDGGRWYQPWRYGDWRGDAIDPATRLDG
ncbi:MAG: membrane protein insertion efficiency factor YidD [Hyphomicrobiales bacterium]|nr:membrane protein insertion efficiency factor YidD [Hyphomicrobiales bacterium]